MDTNNITRKVAQLPINQIKDFPNHPFKIIDDDSMGRLIYSIKTVGVQEPVYVRKKSNSYEMISGHRRKYACEKLGLKTIPAIIIDANDDEAALLMVNLNEYRESISTMEKAFAYKIRMEASKHQGIRTDLIKESKKNTPEDEITKALNDSTRQIQRYIRLTLLIPEFQKMVDDNTLKFRVAVELSYLNAAEQSSLFAALTELNIMPSLQQAEELKNLAKQKELDRETIINVLLGKAVKPKEPKEIVLPLEKINKFFPNNYSQQQKEELIIKLLKEWHQRNYLNYLSYK